MDLRNVEHADLVEARTVPARAARERIHFAVVEHVAGSKKRSSSRPSQR